MGQHSRLAAASQPIVVKGSSDLGPEDLQRQGQHLSIVISDFIMPGMRGDELLIELHQRSPKTITIMLTSIVIIIAVIIFFTKNHMSKAWYRYELDAQTSFVVSNALLRL